MRGYCYLKFKKVLLNYTLSQLRDRVNEMIKIQGEDAHCAAWIYTREDCHLKDEDGEIDYENNVEDPEVIERIFDDVGNIDYCLLYTSPSPRDQRGSRMPSSA